MKPLSSIADATDFYMHRGEKEKVNKKAEFQSEFCLLAKREKAKENDVPDLEILHFLSRRRNLFNHLLL